ncbi:MAG: Rieske (2Fe-2S) protein [Ilumatobacteraceae bacterium]
MLKSIGPQPVIMTRDRDGVVRLVLNRCSHRANLVCDLARGNASTFRCPYHGWTFSTTGQLLGYPFSSGYGGGDQARRHQHKADLGLAQVARVEEIHGFVFGSGRRNCRRWRRRCCRTTHPRTNRRRWARRSPTSRSRSSIRPRVR